MNNQSKKPEKLHPQDSGQKRSDKGKDNKAAGTEDEDTYKQEDAEFKNPAKQREASEQPVNPVKKAPKEK